MKFLYHISQSENNGYDTYSDFVVCAENEEAARNTHPLSSMYDLDGDPWKNPSPCWCKLLEQVEVKLIGKAHKDLELGIICASFHAG